MRQNNSFSLKEIYKNQLFWTFSGFIVLSLIMTILSEQFLTFSNIINVIRQISINGVIAVGMTFVILISGIDLSVGSVMAFSGTMMAAAMVNWEWPVTLAILFGLFIGFVFGLINGSLVAFLKLPAIIVTLAMMEVPRGLALLYTGGYPLSGAPDSFGFFG
ncbi:MAG: ABC transporter permease, partial [Bacillota bacterium]